MRSMIIAAALCGGLFGVGVMTLWVGLITSDRSLHEFNASLGSSSLQRRRRVAVLMRWTAEAQRRHGRELELCEQSAERFVSTRLLLMVEFGAIPLVWLALSTLGLVPAPTTPAVMVIFSGVAAGLGWILARVQLHSEAKKRIDEFSTALAAYTELVAVLIAGGAGPDTATQQAVTVGGGPAFRHLSAAVAASAARREPPWRTLRALGERLGVEDLIEFGASMELAGDGSRITEALTAKSMSIRERELSRELAVSESRSEMMVAPVALMLLGVFVLIGFPIAIALTTIS